jgi:hypothetical protein
MEQGDNYQSHAKAGDDDELEKIAQQNFGKVGGGGAVGREQAVVEGAGHWQGGRN